MGTDAHEVMLKALHMQDANRPRSLQKEIGVSAMGGCARRVWFDMNGMPQENPTDKLEAIMGTAIHNAIETSLDSYSFGTYQTELEVEYNGLKGHLDWWRPEKFEIVDWKTMKMKNAGYFPKSGQRWQIHTYGYLMENNGYRVEQVTLVAIMRDGGSKDVLPFTEPYDVNVAHEGLQWLDNVKQSNQAPAPEMDAEKFCRKYCPYFGELCQGLQPFKKRVW
jgi:CRISPR/Cas system-associated exonuclease Cas4 (RecB family)